MSGIAHFRNKFFNTYQPPILSFNSDSDFESKILVEKKTKLFQIGRNLDLGKTAIHLAKGSFPIEKATKLGN